VSALEQARPLPDAGHLLASAIVEAPDGDCFAIAAVRSPRGAARLGPYSVLLLDAEHGEHAIPAGSAAEARAEQGGRVAAALGGGGRLRRAADLVGYPLADRLVAAEGIAGSAAVDPAGAPAAVVDAVARAGGDGLIPMALRLAGDGRLSGAPLRLPGDTAAVLRARRAALVDVSAAGTVVAAAIAAAAAIELFRAARLDLFGHLCAACGAYLPAAVDGVRFAGETKEAPLRGAEPLEMAALLCADRVVGAAWPAPAPHRARCRGRR